MDAALAADGEHGDNAGVVELGGRLGLGAETLKLPWVQGRGEGQHLEGDLAVQRDLLRLVDDAHAPAAHLAQQAEIAQLAHRGSRRRGPHAVAQSTGEVADLVPGGEELAQRACQVGMLGHESLAVGLLPGLHRLDVRQQHLVEAVGVSLGQLGIHGPVPSRSRSNSRRRWRPRNSNPITAGLVFCTASATSAMVQPWRWCNSTTRCCFCGN